MSNIDLSKLSAQELEALLAKKREEDKKDYERRKELYEMKRDIIVNELVTTAKQLHLEMSEFKNFAIQQLEEFRLEAMEYGDIRKNSKGGFSLRNTDGDNKVMYERNTLAEYDERADMAEELLRDFLADMVKKRDAKAYELVTGLLERGKSGKFNPAAIAALLKMEDKYSDERWVKAMKLFKEAYNNRLIAMNVSFYTKDQMGKDTAIPLTFASLQINREDQEKIEEVINKEEE